MTVQPRPPGRPREAAIAATTSGLGRCLSTREPVLISRPWIRVADVPRVADPDGAGDAVREISAPYRQAA